jgi:fructokinase
VSLVDLVKASDDDVAWLYPDLMPHEVARHWVQLGAAVAVVTRGPHGAFAVTADGELEVTAPTISLVDTVGAGDTFMAGLLAGLSDAGVLGRSEGLSPRERLARFDADALAEVLNLAAHASGFVCTREGADPPTRAELADFTAAMR